MKKSIQYILFSLLVLSVGFTSTNAQQIAKGETGTFALTNATIHTITKGEVSGTLLIQDGKIGYIGAAATIPTDAKTIDCSGLHIYPGLIDGGTQLGLVEVGSISLTRDANEIGNFTPQMQALTAVNPNAVAIPVTRVEGVTTVLTAPTGGRFPGTSALIDLWGYTPDQMFAGFKGVVMNYPSGARWGRWDRRSDEVRKKEKEKAMKELKEAWEEAKLYAKLSSASAKLDYNPQMEVLAAVVNGESTLLIEVNKGEDIEAALKWVEEQKIKAIFTGVAEGWRVADKIAQSGIPVITGPILSIPTRDSDRYDKAYANAGIMQKAGVKVAIRTSGSENVRNLPYNAGFAVAYGMDKEEALKAITIIPAEIFGVADQIGSLEVGKHATLFVTTGDPFETSTDIKHVFIRGWKIPLDSRHTRLYYEFLERSPGK